jgi:two-component system, LytTR family, sensor kinase
VEDDGVGVEPGRSVTEPVSGLVREGSGIGLRNVRERMQVLYGDEAVVEMVSRPGRGTRVRLSMPVMSHEREEGRRPRAMTAGR